MTHCGILAFIGRVVVSLVVAGAASCSPPSTPAVQVRAAEPTMLGDFLDD
jgi:hypothetical protein